MENKGSDCQGTIRNPAEMITISSFTCFFVCFSGFSWSKRVQWILHSRSATVFSQSEWAYMYQQEPEKCFHYTN